MQNLSREILFKIYNYLNPYDQFVFKHALSMPFASHVTWNANLTNYFAQQGNLKGLQWARQYQCDWNEQLSEIAICHQNWSMLQWAINHGAPWSSKSCDLIAKFGNVHILKWARKRHAPWSSRTCYEAARRGDLSMLKYLRHCEHHDIINICKHMFKTTQSLHNYVCPWHIENVIDAASESGNLECLQWILNKTHIKGDVCCRAARHGHLHILQYAHENQYSFEEAHITKALEHEHHDCVLFMHQHGARLPRHACLLATQYGGHLSMIKYAYQHGCELTIEMYHEAIKRGHIHIFEWLYEQGCTWNDTITLYAAKYGQLACLILAHENRCAWHERTCAMAAEGGYFDCLIYARNHGARWPDDIGQYVAHSGNVHCLRYVIENESSFDYQLCYEVIRTGDLESVQYLCACSLNYKWQSDWCIEAARYDHVHILQWLHENGCQFKARKICDEAMKHKQEQCLQYVLRHHANLQNYVEQNKFKFTTHECMIM